MKKVEILDKLNNMTDAELEKELKKAYTDAQKNRLESESKKGVKVSDLKKSRRYIAQILTIQNQRQGQ